MYSKHTSWTIFAKIIKIKKNMWRQKEKENKAKCQK